MHGQIDLRHSLLLAEVESAATELQPGLLLSKRDPEIELVGVFVLSGSAGAFDEYSVRIVVDDQFPEVEPKVFEIAGRIKRVPDLHINPDGSCCLTVWEEWLVIAPGASFKDFLRGPVHDYFLNQWWFENKGYWRFGERSHGARGIVEAYADVLKISAKAESVIYYLRLLSKKWPKGHWCCPCGSGAKLRNCHREELWQLHERISLSSQCACSRDCEPSLGPSAFGKHLTAAVHRS